jgi:hypothetical protein
MAIILTDKPGVGVSACNAGARVRYNRAGLLAMGQRAANEGFLFAGTPVVYRGR